VEGGLNTETFRTKSDHFGCATRSLNSLPLKSENSGPPKIQACTIICLFLFGGQCLILLGENVAIMFRAG